MRNIVLEKTQCDNRTENKPMTTIVLEMVYLLERSQTDTSTVILDLAINKIYILLSLLNKNKNLITQFTGMISLDKLQFDKYQFEVLDLNVRLILKGLDSLAIGLFIP